MGDACEITKKLQETDAQAENSHAQQLSNSCWQRPADNMAAAGGRDSEATTTAMDAAAGAAAGVAGGASDNPLPDTWKYDAQSRLTDAGNKVHAEYDKTTGDLNYVRVGDYEFQRGPNNTLITTKTRPDGSKRIYTDENVQSLTLTTTGDGIDRQGVRVEFGDTGSKSFQVYRSAENQQRFNHLFGSAVAAAKAAKPE